MNTYLAVLAFSLSYVFAAGVRCYQVSGFRLYLVGHSLAGLSLLIFSLLALLVDLEILNISLSWLVLPGIVLTLLPIHLLEAKAQKTSPALWDAWLDKAMRARESNWLDKLFLPRRVRRTSPIEIRLPNGSEPTNAIELLEVLSSQFPALHRFLIGSGVIMLLIALATPSHPNPYLLSSLAFAGLNGVVLGYTVLFFSRKPQLALGLMFLSFFTFFVFLYLLVRVFTYSL